MKRKMLALAACLSLAACSGEADIPAIESEIAAQIEDQADVAVTVDCPSSVDWRVGETFNCVVESVDGDRAMAEVQMEKDGEYTWDTRG
jgi:hypothetical protein